MNPETTPISQQREHTNRIQTEGLFFQREWAVTSARKPNRRNERDSVEETLQTNSSSPNGGLRHNLDTCQRVASKNPNTHKIAQDTMNVANLPFRDEPAWNKAFKPGTRLPSPLSPIQNPITQHEFTGDFSDWLIDSACDYPSQAPLQGSNESDWVRQSSQDSFEVVTQQDGTARAGNEPPELHQRLLESISRGSPSIDMMQDFSHMANGGGDSAGDGDFVRSSDLGETTPNNCIPLKNINPRHLNSEAWFEENYPDLVQLTSAIGLPDGDTFPREEFPGNGEEAARQFRLAKQQGNQGELSYQAPLSANLHSAPMSNSSRHPSPSNVRNSVDAVASSEPGHSHRNLIQLSPPLARAQASRPQDLNVEETNIFIRAGQVYVASLGADDSATTVQSGSSVSYTEADLNWARQYLSDEVKAWLEVSKRKHDAAVGQSLTLNESLASPTVMESHRSQHNMLLPHQQVNSECTAVPTDQLESGPEYSNDNMEGIKPSSMLAHHDKNSLIVGSEPRVEQQQEVANVGGCTGSIWPPTTGPAARVSVSSEAVRLLEQGQVQAISPSVHETGKASISLAHLATEPAVTPLQPDQVISSPLSSSSFVTAEDDEVSLIRTGPSPEYAANLGSEQPYFDCNSDTTEAALSGLSVAPLSDGLSESSQAVEKVKVVELQNRRPSAPMRRPHSGSPNLVPHEISQNLEDIPVVDYTPIEGASFGRHNTSTHSAIGESLSPKSRYSTPQNVFGVSRSIAGSQKLPETQSDRSSLMEMGSSTADRKDHALPLEPPRSNSSNRPSPGTPVNCCRKCGKGYRKRGFLLKHEEKCFQKANGRTLLSMDHMSYVPDFCSIPSLESKLPNGNPYCTGCHQDFSGVGRLKRHIENHCPFLKDCGVYDRRVQRNLQPEQDVDDVRLSETNISRNARSLQNSKDKNTCVTPKASISVNRFEGEGANPENNKASSPSPWGLVGRKDSSSFDDTSLNTLDADVSQKPRNETRRHRFLGFQIFSGLSPVPSRQPLAELVGFETGATLDNNAEMSAHSAVSEVMETPSPLREAAQELQEQRFVETPEAPDDDSKSSARESFIASDDELCPIEYRSIDGDDRECILEYPERTRLFSGKIPSAPLSLDSPMGTFEDLTKQSKPGKIERTSTLTDDTDPFTSASAKVKTAKAKASGADKVSNLIVSLPNKTMCVVAHGKLSKDLYGGFAPSGAGVMIWPFEEVPGFPHSTFEFQITTSEYFDRDLIAILSQSMPVLVFTHYEDNGWVAALKDFPINASRKRALNANPTGHDDQQHTKGFGPGSSSRNASTIGNKRSAIGNKTSLADDMTPVVNTVSPYTRSMRGLTINSPFYTGTKTPATGIKTPVAKEKTSVTSSNKRSRSTRKKHQDEEEEMVEIDADFELDIDVNPDEYYVSKDKNRKWDKNTEIPMVRLVPLSVAKRRKFDNEGTPRK